jgi:hypothetical protein
MSAESNPTPESPSQEPKLPNGYADVFTKDWLEGVQKEANRLSELARAQLIAEGIKPDFLDEPTFGAQMLANRAEEIRKLEFEQKETQDAATSKYWADQL